MPPRRTGIALSARMCHVLAGCLILGAALLHLYYLTYHCPLDLASDEAHYWDWSRHVDWSYYSKGPLVAWLIHTSCAAIGSWSEMMTGNVALAVRLPAVLCGSLLLVSLYVLTLQVYRSERLALAVVAVALTLPIIAVGASIMTIDSPYTCCWGWSLVLTHRALFRGARWAWPMAGLVIGAGMLAKQTMVLFVPFLFLFLLFTPEQRWQLRQRGIWVLASVAALSCLPILVWNAQHHWITFEHLRALAGFGVKSAHESSDEPAFFLLGPLHYLGGQAALLLGFWFVVWLLAMAAHRPGRETNSGVLFLWWLSAPMFVWFGLFSFKTNGGEVNWPVTAYLSGLVLAAAWLRQQLRAPPGWYRTWTLCNIGCFSALGLTITLFLHHSEWLHPVLARVAGAPTSVNRFPLRKFDPTCRLRGWQTLAAAVDAERRRLRAQGIEVELAGQTWTLPGVLGAYCEGHPQAYSVGLLVGDRHSQYDLWPGPLTDAELFRGKTFLYVGDPQSAVLAGFDRVEPSREIVHYEHGRPISCWVLTVCHRFKGFPSWDAERQVPKY